MKKLGLLVLLMLGFAQVSATEADYANMSAKELDAALVVAVKKGSFGEVQKLVGAGAHVNNEITITGSLGRGEGCMDYMLIHTLLEYAAINGYLDIVKELIKAGAVIDVDHPQYSSYGATALIGAAGSGHVDVVKELIKAGADVNHRDKGQTALGVASCNGHANVVRELLKAGANVNDVDVLGTALTRAAEEGHVDVVRELIRAGADVNYVDWEYTVLIKAAMRGHADVVRELIKAGADVNRAGSREHNHQMGNTALIETANRGHSDVIKELIKGGAHVNLTNKNGDTALMCAIKNHDFDVVKSLLQSPEFDTGIWQLIKDVFSDSETKSINFADKDGNTALILAIKYARFSYIKGNMREYNICKDSQNILNALLETPGVDFHHANKKGETAIKLLEQKDLL